MRPVRLNFHTIVRVKEIEAAASQNKESLSEQDYSQSLNLHVASEDSNESNSERDSIVDQSNASGGSSCFHSEMDENLEMEKANLVNDLVFYTRYSSKARMILGRRHDPPSSRFYRNHEEKLDAN